MKILRDSLVAFLSLILWGCGGSDISRKEMNVSATSNSSDVPMPNREELSLRWKEEGLKYVADINSMVERGRRDGWETISRSDEPKDNRGPLAEAVIQVVRQANQDGQIDRLREQFPPAHSPFLGLLEENGHSLPVVKLLND